MVGLWIDFYNGPLAAHRAAILVHVLLAAALLVGVLFRDAVGRWIQGLGAACLLCLALVTVACDPSTLGNPPHWLLVLYPLLAGTIALVYGLLVKNPWCFASAVGCLCGWLAASGWSSYRQARRSIVGLDYIVWGIVSFVLAILVSLSKTGLLRRLHLRGRKRN